MSISSISHRPVIASPIETVSSPVQRVESTPASRPGNDLRQKLMADSFEQGPGKPGAVSGVFENTLNQVSQALGDLMQLLKGLEGQGGQVGDLGEGPWDLASGVDGFSVGGVGGATDTQPLGPGSDAGPGFGAPSAGSTDPVNPSEPWLAKNNVGSPYNSNMRLIEPSQKSQYKYTNTFTNNTNEPQTITLWNKTGGNGNPNDGQNFDKSTPKKFTLQPGESRIVAFDSNSSVAWCASKDGTANPGANSGQTWGEATFANAATGWSGYDTSQISPAGHNGRMSITNEATGHTVTEANAWQTPSDDPAGRDVGVPAGPLNLVTTFS
ncbi:hypothetical protein JRI60_30570 [Archangium violaceum]|uniref:hypothetical protein n=1 Tax=Archangium violaceum TaxID=83451 RepID=UPI00195105D7|nr:hypothetical protein [Archangium violaceum]QRN93517.1 hypothetical protein JRI60_30570 [Archangium violaceum]